MPGPRFHSRMLLLAALVSPLLALACSSASPEQQVLIDFFRAARLRDNTTLANIAAVSFDPRRDGSVQQFTIVSMGAEQRRSLQIGEPGDGAATPDGDVRSRLARERAIAVSSLTPPGRPDADLSTMNVEIVSKQVTVDAQVRTPEGQMVPRMLVFTLQRGVGRHDGQTTEGRWIVADVQQSADSRT